MNFAWHGDGRFARALGHGYDLRAGLLFDRLAFVWIVYDAATMARLEWGEARTMAGAQVQAETIAARFLSGALEAA